MTQKKWIIAVVIVGIVLAWWLVRGGALQETPAPVGADDESFAVIYECANEEVFVLEIQGDGTGRALSTSHEETVLVQDDLTKAWESNDGVVSIYQTGGYTVVVEDGVTTHNECRPQ